MVECGCLREPLSPEACAALADIPVAAMARLGRYVELLHRWQMAMNLVSARSLADPWRRHILDSAQLLPLLPSRTRVLVDLGSGSGFPGLVLAMLGVPEVHLIESDGRKCVFLAEAARAGGLEPGRNPIIHRARIEALEGWPADAITARACAPLDRLLDYAAKFVTPATECLFLKGENVGSELTEAEKQWKMRIERHASRSDPSGIVLRLRHIERATSRTNRIP